MYKRISLFTARQSVSGVPLAQIRLAKALQRRGYEVEYVVGYVPDDVPVPEIQDVNVINLNVDRTYKLALPILFYLWKHQPDVIFTAEDHLNIVVALAVILSGSKAKLSASSRVTPHDTYSGKLFSKKWVLKQLSVILRKRADALVCVSEDMVQQYSAIFGPTKYQCIYNVICDVDTPKKMLEPVDDPWMKRTSVPVVITAGRLAPEKGYSDLIIAMKILTRRTAARLVILGDGPLRPDLEALIMSEGLGDSVRLLGFQDNPYKYFGRSSVFVLSSYVEGLPNALVEAMACGCTPVATDCPTGPREVLKGGEYGHLVPMRNPRAMADAIQRAIEQPMSPKQLKLAIQPFTEESVVRKHQSVLGI